MKRTFGCEISLLFSQYQKYMFEIMDFGTIRTFSYQLYQNNKNDFSNFLLISVFDLNAATIKQCTYFKIEHI